MQSQRMRLLLVVVGISVVGLYAAPAVPADPVPMVFGEAVAPREGASDRHPTRERPVTVDTGLLSPSNRAGTVVFNLFDDAVVEATTGRVVERGPGDYTWVGEVGGLGYAVVTVQHGVVAGRVVDEIGRAFTVTWAGRGTHVVREIDPAGYRPRSTPKPVPDPGGPSLVATARAAGGVTAVDLLVVFTSRAKIRRGGREAMEALITNAVVETNEAFLQSGIGVELRLVGTRQVRDDETGDSELDLELLTGRNDGRMDEVHQWRDAAGADMVTLIVDEEDFCGVAWTMDYAAPFFDAFAFSVVAEDCIDFEATLAHELGHNFGANHEREVVAESNPGLIAVFPYAFGWYLDGEFRTIMAYGSYCTPSSPGRPNWTGCPFALRFSSSSGEYSGFPTGDADSDNARVINNTAPTVAAFRRAVDSSTATCNGLEATVTAADAVDGVIVGTNGDDVIVGSDQADVIKGKAGNDTICSRGGKDIVYGNAGHDTIFGGDLRDVLRGGPGRDTLFGEKGNDKLVGNRGSDDGDGGPGTDTCVSIEDLVACER